MPFDVMPIENYELFRERRERAARLWRSVPPANFDMQDFTCGTAACALGWLAVARVDDWQMGQCLPRRRTAGVVEAGDIPYVAAASYFGLIFTDALACFGGGRETARFHGRCHISAVTGSDVAETLLRLPYDGTIVRRVYPLDDNLGAALLVRLAVD